MKPLALTSAVPEIGIGEAYAGDVAIGSTSSQQIVTITNVGSAPVVMSRAGGAPGGG